MTASSDQQEAALSATVARRIASLRRSHDLSFDGLAQRAGVSKGTLVQVEQGRANPSISTLCRLAAALDVSVADLVTPADAATPVTVVGAGDGRCLWKGPLGGSAVLLAGAPGPDMLEIWQWVLMPGEQFDARAHPQGTRALVHVTQGTLALEVNGHCSLVAAGATAIAFTGQPHLYRNPGTEPVHFTMAVHEPAVSN